MHETNTCMSIVVNHRVCHHHLIARKLERFQIFTVLHFYHGRQIDGGLAGPTALRSRHLAPWGLISIVPFVCKIRVIALLILSSYRYTLSHWYLMLKKNIIASQLFFKLKGQCQCLPLYSFYMQRDSHQFKSHAFWNNSANFVSFWFLYIAQRHLFLRKKLTL